MYFKCLSEKIPALLIRITSLNNRLLAHGPVAESSNKNMTTFARNGETAYVALFVSSQLLNETTQSSATAAIMVLLLVFVARFGETPHVCVIPNDHLKILPATEWVLDFGTRQPWALVCEMGGGRRCLKTSPIPTVFTESASPLIVKQLNLIQVLQMCWPSVAELPIFHIPFSFRLHDVFQQWYASGNTPTQRRNVR